MAAARTPYDRHHHMSTATSAGVTTARSPGTRSREAKPLVYYRYDRHGDVVEVTSLSTPLPLPSIAMPQESLPLLSALPMSIRRERTSG